MMGSCPSIDLTMHVHGRHPGGVLPKEFGKVETAVDGCNSWVLRGDSILEDKNGVCIFIITPGQMSLRGAPSVSLNSSQLSQVAENQLPRGDSCHVHF